MEKKCLVMMPVGDQDGYAQGHFKRVYEYIIVPACKQAGVTPIRADDIPTNDSPWDLIKSIIGYDTAICDFSTRNENVLYGFAIRQAFNLPVTLIMDVKTQPVFDNQEFGVEYNDSLRIDTVQSETQTIGEALLNSLNNKGEINSLLSRLAIGPGQRIEPTNVSIIPEFVPLELVEDTAKPENLLPMISPVPDYVSDPFTQQDIDKIKAGDFFFHMAYGKGEIKTIKDMPVGKMAQVRFDSGVKMLALKASVYFRKMNES